MTATRKLLTVRQRLQNKATLVATATFSTVLILIVFQISVFLDTLTTANLEANDNRTWVVAQLLVDYQRLELSLMNAELTDASAEAWDDVILRHGIYHSRVAVVAAAVKQAVTDQRIDAMFSSLQYTSDQVSRLIAVDGQVDKPRLEQILVILRTGEVVVRKLPNLALEAFSTRAQSLRTSFNLALKQSFIMISALLVAISTTLILLYFTLIELKKRERASSMLSEDLRTTLDASLDVTIIADLANNVAGMNAAGLAMFGLTVKSLDQIRLSDLIQCDDAARVAAEGEEQPRDAMLLPSASKRRRMRARLQTGAWVPVEVSASIGELAEGRQMQIYFLRDLTEQDAADVALRTMRDQARMDARAKDRFMALMSHEMRTPLMGVIASLDLLDGEPSPEERSYLVRTAQACSVTSLEQIEDVLELARLGSDSEVTQPLDPMSIAQAVVGQMKTLADGRGNTIRIDMGSLPYAMQFFGLPQTYRRVLSNLVGNSIKFTQDGLIRIEIAITALAGDDVLLRTTVQDSGIGISQDDQTRIFDEFEVAHDSNDPTLPRGSGLGLAIVKSGVKKMGGAIMLESTPGQGSKFWFDMRLTGVKQKLALDPLPLSVPFSAKNAVVLVVEDNFVNQTLLCRMLARLGHDVELANDGPSAVTLAAVKSFDLILMDINLPGFDGLEATRQIRIAGASKTAPIVGITAQILAQHRERMELVGMNRLVSKPITMNQLKQCLNEVIASNKNPLLNEDNSQDRTNLRALLGDSLLARLQVSCLRDVTLLMSYWPESVLDAVPELFHSNLHRALGSAAVLHEVRLHSILSDANEAAKSHDLERLVNLRHTLTDHVNAVRLRMRFNPSLDDAVGDWGNQSIAVN